MKNYLKLFIITLIFISSIPCITFLCKDSALTLETAKSVSLKSSETPQSKVQAKTTVKKDKKEKRTVTSKKNSQPAKSNDIKLYLSKERKVETLSYEEYVAGCVASEMGNCPQTEALKAQAIVCYTYAMYCKENNSHKSLKGAYLSDDSSKYQAYKSLNTLKSELSDSYDDYMKDILTAVKAVKGEVLTYDDKAILSAYHSCNSGKTHSCKDIWGEDKPYLTSVLSVGDTLSGEYKSTVSFTKEEMISLLKKAYPEKHFSGSSVKITNTGKDGLVNEIKVFSQELKGSELRSALSLNSADFTVRKKSGKYIFTVYGYGHGLGMSQEGAKYMAAQGFTYKEILKHYYSGVEIVSDYGV